MIKNKCYTCWLTCLALLFSLASCKVSSDLNKQQKQESPNKSTEPQVSQADSLHLNQIQVIGSHNSYKSGIEAGVLALIAQVIPAQAKALDYRHISLTEQLDLGLRNLEFDVFHDPAGGRYAKPFGLQALQLQGVKPGAFDPKGVLAQPGMKMFHIQDIDFRSHHLLLKNALFALKKWSNAHPRHLPVFVTVNTKDDVLDRPGFTRPLPFTKAALDSLDRELFDYFGEKLLTPDFVRGRHGSLREAILTEGWPLLDDVRGKFMFVLDQWGEKIKRYVEGHPSLKGRAMFVNSQKEAPEAAVMIMNDPKDQEAQIKSLVQAGFLVRTRADADTREARTGDYTRFEAAKRSGAQIITTDYYQADERLKTGYKVQFDDGVFYRTHPFLKAKAE